MSSEDEEDSGSGSDEEEEDDSEQESGSESGVVEAAQAEKRARAARDDVALVKDIIAHIQQTSRRISERVSMTERLDQLEQMGAQSAFNTRRPVGMQNDWGNYGELSEAERAELLERALLALGQDG